MELIIPYLDWIAMTCFILGRPAMLLAMITALLEFRLNLKPVSLEQDFLRGIQRHRPNNYSTLT